MKFGDRLRELLEINNLSQKQLGEKLNIAPSTIGNYVRNIREPDHATLIIFAEYFNVTVDFLLGHKVKNEFDDKQELIMTVYKGLNSSNKRLLIEQAKLLFEFQNK